MYDDGPGDGSEPRPPPYRADQRPAFAWADREGARDALRATTHAASVGKRVGAYIIDALLIGVVVTIVVFATEPEAVLPATPEGVTFRQTLVISAVQAVVYLVYFVTAESLTGKTVAKWMLGIKVEMADGGPVTFVAALVRRLPLVAGGAVPIFGPVINFTALLAAMVTAIQDVPENRGYHDRWAGTRVIDVRSPAVS